MTFSRTSRMSTLAAAAIGTLAVLNTLSCTSILGSFQLENNDGGTAIDASECTSGMTQPCPTGLTGVCGTGSQNCLPSGSWGSCEVTPTPARCGSVADYNCDGIPDYLDESCTKPIYICGVEGNTCLTTGNHYVAQAAACAPGKGISSYRVLKEPMGPSTPVIALRQCSRGDMFLSVLISDCPRDTMSETVGYVVSSLLIPDAGALVGKTTALRKYQQQPPAGTNGFSAIVAEADAIPAECNSAPAGATAFKN